MKEFIIKNKVLVIIVSIILIGAVIGGGFLVVSLTNNDPVDKVEKDNENASEDNQIPAEDEAIEPEDTKDENNNEVVDEDEKEETTNKETNASKPENKPSTNKPSTNQPTTDTNNNKEETNKTEGKTENKSEDSNTDSNNGSGSTVNNTTNNDETKTETPKVEEDEPEVEDEPVKKNKTYLDCKYENNTKTAILTYSFIWDEYSKMTSAYQDTSTVFDFSPFNDTQIQNIEAGHQKVCTEAKNNGAQDCKYTRRADGYSITIYHNVNTLSQTTNGLLNSSMDANTVKNKLTSQYNNLMICTIK